MTFLIKTEPNCACGGLWASICKIEGSFIFSFLEFYPFFKAILEGKIQFVDSKSISILLDFYSDQSNVMYD